MSLKVLFVDDEKEVCKAFKAVFTNQLISIRTAHDAKSALEAIAEEEPDLIFLDHHLPGITGKQLSKQIQDHIPLVSVSGETDFDPGVRFFRVIGKPFRRHDITVIFESVLKGKGLSQAS